MTDPSSRPFAVIVGASSGIGYQLARCCAEQGFDLLVAADTPDIEDAAQALRETGAVVDSVQADPATLRGVEQIHAAVRGRGIDALLVSACPAPRSINTEDEAVLRQLCDAHITGTLYLLHQLGHSLRLRARVLVTGSVRGFVPAFVDSFSLGLRSQLKESGVTVTCLIPGADRADAFPRTDTANTQVVYCDQVDPTAVATAGFDAMMNADEDGEGLRERAGLGHLVVPPTMLATRYHHRALLGAAGRR